MKYVDLVDDLILMRIFAKLLNPSESDDSSDIHQVQCSACKINPIRHDDRFHCLECPTNYDLCGRCFEKRHKSDEHSTGHAMIHFKLANEFLGIQLTDVRGDLSLDNLLRLDTLKHEKHSEIKCDGVCNQKSIVGLRFKCDVCPNYNLCQTCAIKRRVTTKNHENDHPIVLTSNRIIPKIDFDDVELGEVLGRGGFGYVCIAKWKSKNKEVACKIIEVSSNSQTSKDLQRSFILELAAYRELSGPYILRTYAYAMNQIPASRIRSATTQYMILMELMARGSLQNLLENQPKQISLRRKLAMARQIASAMRRIHQHGIVHRDIRPDNILVTEDYIAKIGDMGIARIIEPNQQQTQIGCLQFMPPEFFINSSQGYYKCDDKLDVFTYGLTLNQLFTEVMHTSKVSPSANQITIQVKSPIFYDEIIGPCLSHDKTLRPTAIQIEQTLQLYEQTFAQTMLSDSYAKMNTKQKDQLFLQFYHKNQPKVQSFFKQQAVKERQIPVQIVHKQQQQQQPVDEPCRLS